MAINNFTKISNGSIIGSHETITDHQSKSDGREASPTGHFDPGGMGGNPNRCFATDVKGVAIDRSGESLWSEPANGGCLDSGCQCPGVGEPGRSPSFRQTSSGDARNCPRAGGGRGEGPQGIWAPSFSLGWSDGGEISEKGLGNFDPGSASSQLAPKIGVCVKEARISIAPSHRERSSSIPSRP